MSRGGIDPSTESACGGWTVQSLELYGKIKQVYLFIGQIFCTDIPYKKADQKDAPQCQHHRQYGQSGEYLASGMPLSVSRYPGRPGRADIRDTTVHLHRRICHFP